MNYLYMTCEDCGREALKKQIFKNYGVQIDSDSLYKDDFAEKVKEIFEKELEEAKRKCKPASVIKEAYVRLHSNEISTEPGQLHLETAIRDLETIISNYENYTDDLAADVLMGLLWSDKNNEIDFKYNIVTEVDGKEKETTLYSAWTQGHKGSSNTRRNYPYADIKKYPEEPVPGGCMAYHMLMMISNNVTIFDIPDKLKPEEDITIYTYQKVDEIYQKIKSTYSENLLLLERSLGIGCTNLWFTYLKDVEDLEELSKFDEIIKLCNKIEPIFLRSLVIETVGKYFSAVEKKIKNPDKIVDYLISAVADVIVPVYKKMFDYAWSIYYLAYKTESQSGKSCLLGNLRKIVAERWNEYYTSTDSKIYPIFVEEYNQYDWRVEKSIEEYFEKLDTYYETVDANHEVSNEGVCWNADVLNKFETVNIRCADGSQLCFLARKPLVGLGEKIRAEAIKECSFEWIKVIELPEDSKLSDRDEQLRELLYEKEKTLFSVMLKQKTKEFSDITCKRNKRKATPDNVYAHIHMQVMKNSLF